MRLQPASRPLARDYEPIKVAVLDAAVQEIYRRKLAREDVLVPGRRMDKTETPDAIEATRLILDRVRVQLVEGGWSNAEVRNTTRLRSIKVAMLDRIKEGDYTGVTLPRAMQLAEALGMTLGLKVTKP